MLIYSLVNDYTSTSTTTEFLIQVGSWVYIKGGGGKTTTKLVPKGTNLDAVLVPGEANLA